jgi:6-phosphofructokinase 1
VPFGLEKLLEAVRDRLKKSGHAVIVVAEGAGQDLMGQTGERDASGNVKFKDIGLFLKERINAYFQNLGMETTLKYIDPSYTIRGVPANAYDSAFCLLLGQNAVHAGMAGRTNMVVGNWMNTFTHVPIPLAVSARKKVSPDSWVWSSVLTSTGQPKEMR